jgi:small GTP-binding protein
VGKTCLLIRYVKDEFVKDYVPTIFDNYNSRLLVNNSLINLGLWDTAGQEEYVSMRQVSYPQTNIFLIIFDLTKKSTFENSIKKWYPEVKKAAPNATFFFIGNKKDLRDKNTTRIDENHIKFEVANDVVENLGCRYFECSALSGEGVKNCFE